ncbi:uncharacterized protein Bfra_004938 [Botrytis fragariae]|uniref:Uncharacterized protein n=1 Tax=Botrytis fragariae TaxID=1964551 RepID=A0A8H6ATT8_9HELO|nr:uncharacterized protein Bfra_004938 [Botrytis fragariae]KAF5873477.1 hypothetical protein Bfra_004938 [Botrytis fragariae]
MGNPLTSQGILDLMSDLDLDWLKIYDDAMREGLKTRAELLLGISDSLDETMNSNPNEMAIIYLAMKERLKCRSVVLKGVAKSLREVLKVLGEMSKACDDALKDMPKTYWEEEEDRLGERECERDYELELKMPKTLERYHALLDPGRVRMRKGALAPRKVVDGNKTAEKDWSLTWDSGLESQPNGKNEKWSRKMEMFEIEATSLVSTLPITPTPSRHSDSLTLQTLPILQKPPTTPVPEISPANSTPQILSTSLIPPTPSSELDTDHSWRFNSGSKKSKFNQEKAPPTNISETKELYPDDLYSDDSYPDDVKWTSPGSNPKSRENPRNMVTDYRKLKIGSSRTKYEGAPIPKSLPMSNLVMQMNYALCRLTDTPLPIRISDALHPFLLFYDVQSAYAVSIENLSGSYGILLYQLLWGDKKHGRVTFTLHPAYFGIDHPDSFSSFVDAPNFDVERTSPLTLDRKPAFILLLQVAKQPPSLRVIKKYSEAVPDWHRIDHLLCLGYREYIWAIYSPADANVCMSHALQTWSQVHHHEPLLFSQECFESMKFSINLGEVKRSDKYRGSLAGPSSLLRGSKYQAKEIENRALSDISKRREYSEENLKKEVLLHNCRARIMFEELYSNRTKSLFDDYVQLNKIYSGLQKLLGKYKILPNATRRMVWTCKCGHASHDDFTELPGREGAVVDFANELMQAGYITRAQITNQPLGTKLWVSGRLQNGINLISRKLSNLRNTPLPTFVKAGLPKNPVCLPADECRWLHLCMKKKPYATHLKPLHVCKDENQDPLTDKTFFKALKHAYNREKTWKDWAILKLRRIEFIGFEACPDDYIDHIKPNDLPPTTNEYDFAPPPPPKMVPPIGPEHMLHLFQDCPSISDVNSNFYLQRIPRRKIEPIAFNANSLSENLGWGLHFVEGLNTSLAISVMFILSSVLGIAFAICWTILEKDIQGAFGVAAYITSVMTLAVMTWQLWAL